jgi:small subunit ribosomal protein S6
MNNYEVVFISTPVLSTEQYKKVVAKYVDFIKENGEVTNHEDWGLRQLAYPIEKKTTGFYTLIEFTVPTEVIGRLEVEFKRDENVMRFLTTRLDKYALAYNDQRKNKLSNKQVAKEEA